MADVGVCRLSGVGGMGGSPSILSGRAVLCRRPFSDGFSHRRCATSAADPEISCRNPKKASFGKVKKSGGIHLRKNGKKAPKFACFANNNLRQGGASALK